MARPHTVTSDVVTRYLDNLVTEVASATTSSGRRKRLARKGTGLYIVSHGPLTEPPVYVGPDVDVAVNSYNNLG